MAHPMKGACTSKSAKVARFADGGSVSVAGYSRSPKGVKAKGYANGGVVEDLAAPGLDAMGRADRAPRGKGHVTNVNITMAPKAEPVLPPPMPPMPPAGAAAPPPPMMMPPGGPPMGPMRNGGRVSAFKNGGAVKAKAPPVKRAYGGPIPMIEPGRVARIGAPGAPGLPGRLGQPGLPGGPGGVMGVRPMPMPVGPAVMPGPAVGGGLPRPGVLPLTKPVPMGGKPGLPVIGVGPVGQNPPMVLRGRTPMGGPDPAMIRPRRPMVTAGPEPVPSPIPGPVIMEEPNFGPSGGGNPDGGGFKRGGRVKKPGKPMAKPFKKGK